MFGTAEERSTMNERRERRGVEPALEHLRAEPGVARVGAHTVERGDAELQLRARGPGARNVLELALRRVRRVKVIVDEVDEALMKVRRADGCGAARHVMLGADFPARRALRTEVGICAGEWRVERLEERRLAERRAKTGARTPSRRKKARGRDAIRREVTEGAAVIEACAGGRRRQTGGAQKLDVHRRIPAVIVRRCLVLSLSGAANGERGLRRER